MDDADTSTQVEEVDLLIIGGGKAGKSLAMDRAKAGWSVAMVERDKIGGTCINVACIPTKSLIESARTLIDAQSAADMGVAIDGTPTVSLELLRRHKESVVGGMVAAYEDMFASSGMDFILGTAHFIAEQTVCVDVNDGTTVVAEEVLLATRRAPVTSELHLEAAGVDVDARGFVNVDEQLRTTSPNIWAAGDITGGPQFTHLSWHDFRVLRDNLTGGSATTTDRLVPYTVFITPELARVGLNETEARDQGHSIRVATLPVAKIPRAKTIRKTEGVWKAIVDADTELILGATLLGHNAGEVITTVQMAMLSNMTYQQLRDAIITHPTMGEGLNLLFDALEPASSSNA